MDATRTGVRTHKRPIKGTVGKGAPAGAPDTPEEKRIGFAVTQRVEVGYVVPGVNGQHSMHEAAFLLVAETGAAGVFEWPGTRLIVEHTS